MPGFSQIDYLFGKSEEQRIKPYLEAKFGRLNETKKHCAYDFYNDDYQIEVKSRKNTSFDYPTTLLCSDKVLETDKQQIYIFNFRDKILYLEFDKELFKTFELKIFERRGGYVPKPYYHIPLDKLKEINQTV